MNGLKSADKVLLATLVLFLSGQAPASDVPNLKTLYEQHRWFDLRDAIKLQPAPAFYKGAVAAAFKDGKTAEAYLDDAIKAQPNSADAKESHEILGNLHARTGRYKAAV